MYLYPTRTKNTFLNRTNSQQRVLNLHPLIYYNTHNFSPYRKSHRKISQYENASGKTSLVKNDRFAPSGLNDPLCINLPLFGLNVPHPNLVVFIQNLIRIGKTFIIEAPSSSGTLFHLIIVRADLRPD